MRTKHTIANGLLLAGSRIHGRTQIRFKNVTTKSRPMPAHCFMFVRCMARTNRLQMTESLFAQNTGILRL